MKNLIYKSIRKVRVLSGNHPAVFYRLFAASWRVRERRVRANTELVLEGFPRCANSFAVRSFLRMQGREVRIAHHLHVMAQVLEGLHLGVPVCLLVRDPADAVVSLAIRTEGISAPPNLLENYIRFHRRALEVAESIVVADFNEVTRDFGQVVARINAKFGVRFAIDSTDDDLQAKVFEDINWHSQQLGLSELQVSRPSEAKSKLKKELLKQLPSDRLALAHRLYRACLDADSSHQA